MRNQYCLASSDPGSSRPFRRGGERAPPRRRPAAAPPPPRRRAALGPMPYGNPMWAHILRLLDDEEQATMVLQIFKQAMITRARRWTTFYALRRGGRPCLLR